VVQKKEKEPQVAEELEKEKKSEEELPYCTTAPSAEHHRAHGEDEPCDDATSGTEE